MQLHKLSVMLTGEDVRKTLIPKGASMKSTKTYKEPYKVL